MATFNVTGTVTNSDGVSTPFTGAFTTTEAPVINSVSVSPNSAPPGTQRTITINATDPQGEALSYTCQVNGVNATPTAQRNVFTFVA